MGTAARRLDGRRGESKEMDEDNRNWILAIVVSFTILIVYQLFFSEPPRTPHPETQMQDQRAPE